MGAHRIIVCWCMGLTQHKNSVATIQEVMNFLLLRGNIGRPGAGPCPVRGHSNVQGDRTMGIWDKPKKEFLDKLAAEFGFEPPRPHGFDMVESIKAMHDGRAKVLFAMGGNFVAAMSDTEYTAAALRKCRLTAHVSIKLNRSHLVTGRTALILPCLGRTEIDRQSGGEQFQTVEDSMGVINPTRGNLKPASRASAQRVGHRRRPGEGGPRSEESDRLGRLHRQLRPDPGQDRGRDPGVSLVQRPDPRGHVLSAQPAARPAEIRNSLRQGGLPAASAHARHIQPGEYLMTTIRSHDQFNTSIYGLDDRYRGIYNGRRVVFMNEEDMQGGRPGAGPAGRHHQPLPRPGRATAERFMVAPYPVPRRCTATLYFPEANVLVPIDSVADQSNTPGLKIGAHALRAFSGARGAST